MRKQVLIIVALVLGTAALFLSAGGPARAADGIDGRTLYTYGETRDASQVELLIASLDHQDRHLRRIAARALGKIGDPRAVTPLIRVLLTEHEVPAVRAVAAWSLGAMKAGAAVQALSSCLDCGDPHVRRQSGIALRKIANHYVRLANLND